MNTMEYNSIKNQYGKNDLIKSLDDGNTYKYSGHLTLVGLGKNRKAYDSSNEALVVYKGGKLATVIKKGIDHDHQHIDNVINTCKRLGCTPNELLQIDYMSDIINENFNDVQDCKSETATGKFIDMRKAIDKAAMIAEKEYNDSIIQLTNRVNQILDKSED